MNKAKGNRNDREAGFGIGGPQDGPIGDGSDDRQQQQGEASTRQAGLHGGDQGEGGQRYPDGSSRDDAQQG